MSLVLRPLPRGPGHDRYGDTFLERMSKLVPTEVLAVLLPVVTFLPSTAWYGWSLLAVGAGTLLVPLLLYWDAARAGLRVSAVQYVVRTLEFPGWALVLSEPAAAVTLDPRAAAVGALIVLFVGERLIADRGRETS